MIHIKTKDTEIPLRTSRGLNWENDTLTLKRSNLNLFTSKNFAEKSILKLVEPFSSPCLAIKSKDLAQSRLQMQNNSF